GSHLTTGHAVDPVVDQEDGDRLAPVRRVDELGQADGDRVPVSLDREDQEFGVHPLDARHHGRRSSVGGLDGVDVQILVSEDAAPDRVDQNRSFPHAHLMEGDRDEPRQGPVLATRAIVGGLAGERGQRAELDLVVPFDVDHRTIPSTSWTISEGEGIRPPTRCSDPTWARPPVASCTSCIIWPVLSSTTRNFWTPRSTNAVSSPFGNGERVIGRRRPTRTPLARSVPTARWHRRAQIP